MSVMPNNIYVETIGTGPNLVLIHGWGMSGAVWQPLVKKLSKSFTLHIVDLPGMGLSRPIEPFHLHAAAEKVAEILPANADVVGLSLGAQVAMRIALDYDGTYTADPELWEAFIHNAHAAGHEVVCVTMRYPHEGAPGIPCRVVFTSRLAKWRAMIERGEPVDVWIDDQPGYITQDAVGI